MLSWHAYQVFPLIKAVFFLGSRHFHTWTTWGDVFVLHERVLWCNFSFFAGDGQLIMKLPLNSLLKKDTCALSTMVMCHAFNCCYLFQNVSDQWTDTEYWLWKHLANVCMEVSAAQAFPAIPNTAYTHSAFTLNGPPGQLWSLRLLDFTAYTEHLCPSPGQERTAWFLLNSVSCLG